MSAHSETTEQQPTTNTPLLPPLQLDEYDVVIPKVENGGQFRLQYTTGGDTIFWDYKRLDDGSRGPAEIYQWFRNQGDVFLAVDGTSTAGQAFQEVTQMMKRSWQERPFSCFRMRDSKYAKEPETSYEKKLDELVKEINNHQEEVTKKEREIVDLERDIQLRKQEVFRHNNEIVQIKAQIKSLQQEELTKKQEQVAQLQKTLAGDADGDLTGTVESSPPQQRTSNKGTTSPTSSVPYEHDLVTVPKGNDETIPFDDEETERHDGGAERGTATPNKSAGGAAATASSGEESADVDGAVAYLLRGTGMPERPEHFIFEEVEATSASPSRALLCPRPGFLFRRKTSSAISPAVQQPTHTLSNSAT